MSSDRKDMLFDLICSLSKSEKRHFNIYAKRIKLDGKVLFLDLFDYLEKQDEYDAGSILKDLPGIKKSQLSNVKRSLYNHILSSLSLLYDLKRPALKIRTFMNYAELLYSKGLYFQSLKLLSRAKKIAIKNHEESLHLDIIIQEQKIQSRHITRSTTTNMQQLIQDADEMLNIKLNISSLSNLKLYLQRQFIIHGPDIREEHMDRIQADFNSKIKCYDLKHLTLVEGVYYHQCHYWINYIKHDYEACLLSTKEWNKLFVDHPTIREKDFDLFLICKHHYSNMLFFTKRHSELAVQRFAFRDFIEDGDLNLNSFLLANLFNLLVEFDYCTSTQTYTDAFLLIKKARIFLQNFETNLDSYKIHILYYKMACLYMGLGAFEKAIDPLNEIINSKNPLRQEIVCYARLLLIICYVELEDDDMAMYFTTQTKRYINTSSHSTEFMKLAINFFHKLLKTHLLSRIETYRLFSKQLHDLKSLCGYHRAKIFIDLKTWVDSKKQIAAPQHHQALNKR